MIDLTTLPGNPGCYLFSDVDGTIIYVGKAKNLKKRVTSYFQKTDHDPKTRNLISRIEIGQCDGDQYRDRGIASGK